MSTHPDTQNEVQTCSMKGNSCGLWELNADIRKKFLNVAVHLYLNSCFQTKSSMHPIFTSIFSTTRKNCLSIENVQPLLAHITNKSFENASSSFLWKTSFSPKASVLQCTLPDTTKKSVLTCPKSECSTFRLERRYQLVVSERGFCCLDFRWYSCFQRNH